MGRPDPGGDAPPPATGALMPLVSIRRHWRVGLAVALAVALLGGYLGYKKGKPVYSTTATIYVASKFVNILRESKDFDVASYQQFRQFVEHQTQTIGRYDIVLATLKKLEDQGLGNAWKEPQETERQAAERLIAALKIVAIKDTYLITVTLDSGRQENLDVILNTLVDTYIETQRRENLFYGQDIRAKSLGEHKDEVFRKLEAHRKRRTEIAQQIGVTTFTPNGANPYDKILLDSRSALADSHRDVIAAQAALDAWAGKGGAPSPALLAFATEEISKDPGLNTLKSNLLGRRADLLEKLSGLDQTHPLRRMIDRELNEIDQEIDRASASLLRKSAQGLIEQRQSDLHKAEQVERDLEKQVEVHLKKGAWFTNLYHEALALSDNIDREQNELEEIDNRLDFFKLEQQAPGYVRVETAARPPEHPISGGRKKLMIMALVGGAVLGLIVPIVLDLLDRRIRTSGQAAKILGYPPMAAFFEPSDDVAVRRVDADRKRRLAIALDRERRQRNARVFLLTSVRPRAGVTGLAFEMARELGELGDRCLVIEANPLNPDQRYQAEGYDGLDDLLAGVSDVQSTIVPAKGLLPDHIGIGLPVLPHLHNCRRLRDLLEEFKATYDLIFLDAPPVLLSADTEFLASLADVTLLIIGALQTLPGDLKKAVKVLQKVDPEAVGFIVTHLEIYRGGGYFGKLLEDYSAVDEAARQVLRSHPYARKPT